MNDRMAVYTLKRANEIRSIDEARDVNNLTLWSTVIDIGVSILFVKIIKKKYKKYVNVIIKYFGYQNKQTFYL